MKSKLYYRNFLTLLTGNTISQMVPFIVAPILTRIFSPEEFAVFANFMAIVGVIGIISTGRLELAIPLPKEKASAQNIVFTGLIITLSLGLLSVLIPVFAGEIANFYNDPQLEGYLWMVPIAIISYGLLGISTNWNLRNEKFRSLSVSKISQSVVNNALAALLGYIGWGINGLIISWLISQYINILMLSMSVERKISRKDFGIITIKSTLKEYKDFPLINSLHAFTDIFATQFVLFWLISSFFGSVELGLFAMMHKYVKAPIALISTSVSQLFYVEAGKSINNNLSMLPVTKRTIGTSVLFGIPFITVLIFFGPMLFRWYLGNDWEAAGVYAVRLSPVFLLMFITSPISGIPILLNKQKGAFLLSVLGYSLSFLALALAIQFQLEFTDALWYYSIAFSIYYLTLIFWYFSLIKKRNESIV